MFKPQPQATRRLICFAHAGGAASAFSTWHRQFPSDIEICAVQLAGRESRRREPFAQTIEAVVDSLVNALAPLHDRPVALFGYSLGGVMAFEYARALRRASRTGPTHLVVGASRAPHRPVDLEIQRLSQTGVGRDIDARYDGIPHAILNDPELLAYFLPVIRADLALLAKYRYRAEEPLACPITVLGGRDDARIPPPEIAHWAAQTSARFEHHTYPGGHFFISSVRDEALSTIARAIRQV